MLGKMFSLIVATINRTKELDELLNSIKNSDYNLEKIEVIIVDQNKNLILEEIIFKYASEFKIIHIKSEIKGLSKNRNIGIKVASGEIICFPDDDCKYTKDIFSKVEQGLESNRKIDFIMGRIIDQEGNDCLKKWPKKSEVITKENFLEKVSSITIFLRKNNIKFNEKLGAGEYFGSSEDVEYIYENLKYYKKASYNPNIIVYHPKSDSSNFNYKKAYSYGLGFGAFCRKNLNFHFFKILILGSAWAAVRAFFNLGKLDFSEAKTWGYSSIGRLRGFLEYR